MLPQRRLTATLGAEVRSETERSGTERDEPLEALDHLVATVQATSGQLEAVLARAERIRAGRAQGRSYAEIVGTERAPLAVEILTESLAGLAQAGARWRRAEAAALHAEGLTMERIAALFGVTRQRVSALLRASAAGAAAANRGSGPGRDGRTAAAGRPPSGGN